METTKYNGWTNYETGMVALWLDNEESRYLYWRTVADEIMKLTAPGDDRRVDAIATLADRLKDEIHDSVPAEPRDLFANLLLSALAEVNWREIAENILADLPADEDEEARPWTGTRPALDADPKFDLGTTLSTPGAIQTIDQEEMMTALARHHRGDWGDCCVDDWESNEEALTEGFRLFSVYHTAAGEQFWIITEHDRSVTTILRPSEY